MRSQAPTAEDGKVEVSSACTVAGPGSVSEAGRPVLQCLRLLQPQRGCWLSLGAKAPLPRCPRVAVGGAEPKPHWEQKGLLSVPRWMSPHRAQAHLAEDSTVKELMTSDGQSPLCWTLYRA